MHNGQGLELTGVTKQYGRRRLFSDISLRLRAGESLAVTGPNGAGKSTLLRIIAGLERPSGGSVSLYAAGEQVASQKRLAHAGMVSPEIVLYNAMTGLENVSFFTELQGQAVATDGLPACLDRVGLAARGNDMVGSYSTGMRQRLKFALLLAMARPLWLLDEPSSNLDSDGKAVVTGLIAEAVRQGRIVVIATNEPEEAAYAKQRIALV